MTDGLPIIIIMLSVIFSFKFKLMMMYIWPNMWSDLYVYYYNLAQLTDQQPIIFSSTNL